MNIYAMVIPANNEHYFKVVHAQTKSSAFKIASMKLIKSGSLNIHKIKVLDIGKNKFAKKGIVFETKDSNLASGVKKYHKFVDEIFQD